MEDWTGDGFLNRDEFEHAMNKCGIFLTASEISTVTYSLPLITKKDINKPAWVAA